MMTPVRNGNVPASTPPLDHPMPLSMLETTTAKPKLAVSAAVAVSSARRDIIDRSCPNGTHNLQPDLSGSLDQPALLARDLLQVAEVFLDEGLEGWTGQERINLRRLLDVILPFRRRLHLLHQVDIEGCLIGVDLARQPHRPGLLILGNGQTL